MPVTAKPASYTAGAATLRPNHLWMFDEGSGTTLTDIGSTGGKDLTIVGADWATDGTHGPILSFVEANSDYAHRTETASEPVMGITTGFTVALLIKTVEASKDMVGICDASGIDPFFMGGADITPEQRWSVRDDGAVSSTADDIVGATFNTSWHWCVWTFGTNAQTGSYDGTLYGSAALTGDVALAANQALLDRFCIGGRVSSSPAYADIEVGAAAVWVNTILSEAQQLSLWNSGDVWTAMGISEGLPAGTPTITDVDTDENVTHGEELTVTGTEFGAAQATHTSVVEIVAGTLAVTQTCSGWSDTGFTIAAANTTGLPFGGITGLRITNVNGEDELPLTHSTPAGYAYGVVDVPWPDGTYSLFDSASPAVADGDQYEYEVLTDQGVPVEVFADGTLVIDSDTGTHQLDIRVFDQTDETWSDWITATVSAEPTGGELVEVPNVVPMSESSARFLLQEAGFVVTTTNSSSLYIAFGDVISTYPTAGEYVDYGTDVLMVVSIGTQAPGEHGAGYPVGWQGKRKKLTLAQQPNKHLKKLLDDVGKKVLATHAKPKKSTKVKPIKLWS
jgi:hypothetical protein